MLYSCTEYVSKWVRWEEEGGEGRGGGDIGKKEEK